MIAPKWKDFEVIASGGGEKLERWKDVLLLRPDPQAIWAPPYDLSGYKGLAARYIRSSSGGGRWEKLGAVPESWTVSYGSLKFVISPMGFKHVGLFPEQSINWEITAFLIMNANRPIKALNLFGYTGGITAAMAKAGAKVTHVDAAKNMVARAKENCSLSGIPEDRLRFIVDDCAKFVAREIRRGNRYDAVVLDPPSYGRGPGGELWKIEDDLYSLMQLIKGVLSDDPLFLLLNSYTTGLQPTVAENMVSLTASGFKGARFGYELGICTSDRRDGEGEGIVLPCGASGLWTSGKLPEEFTAKRSFPYGRFANENGKA